MGVGPIPRTRALLDDCNPCLVELSLGLPLVAVAVVEEGQGNLKLVDVRRFLETLDLGALLRLKRGLEELHCTFVVLN